MLSRFDLWSRYVARSGRPIIIGPWREEIGSEILYWLSWVAQWCHCYQIPRERLIAVSRGGAAHWYGAGAQVELYDYWPPDVLRIEALRDATERGSVKQTRETAMERTLYPTITTRLGVRRYHILHPRHMYADIAGWADATMPMTTLLGKLRFMSIPTPPVPLGIVLPERFACVRFYQRHTWMFTEEVKAYCTELVGNLAKHIPVVIIGSGHHHDDHLDLNITGPNITSLIDVFPVRENLALQSAVMAKCVFFVGTYGGTMQLASRLGKPSAGFYLKFTGTAYNHKVLTEWLALQQGVPIWIGTPQQAELLRSVVSVPLELPEPVGSSSGVMG